MATLEDLKDAVRDSLESRGVLGKVKAQIRAEIFASLDDPDVEKPPLSNENMIINELIREYLEFNRYKYSLSVFVPETGQPSQPLDRGFLATELNIAEDSRSRSVPLLYGILAKLQHQRQNPPVPLFPPESDFRDSANDEQVFVRRPNATQVISPTSQHTNPPRVADDEGEGHGLLTFRT